MRPGVKLLLLALALVFFDQALKRWFRYASADWGFVSLHFVANTGASFGILQRFGPLLLWVSVMVLGGILYFFDRAPHNMRLPLTLVAAGVLGNLIDRVRLGYVVDFVDLHWFPVFNVADSCITIGVAWMIAADIFGRPRGPRRKGRTAGNQQNGELVS